MNTSGTLSVVDEYVDALLGDVMPVEATAVAPSISPATEAVDEPAAAPAPAEAKADVAAGDPPVPPAPAPSRVVAMPAPHGRLAAVPAHASDAPAALPAMPAMPETAPVQSRPLIASAQRWLRVAVGGDSYALELLSVQEVVRMAPIVAMRGAERAVLGVMNLRGRIVPVFDLGLWLDAGCVQPDERSRIVVVERNDELIGLLVSQVEDVVTLGRERIEPPLVGTPQGAVLGIARVGAAPTVLLDAGALFG